MDLNKELYLPKEAAKILRITSDTIRLWISNGKIKPDEYVTFDSGHRRIKRSCLMRLLNEQGKVVKRINIIYARESSSHQKESLNKQVDQLLSFTNSNGISIDKVITDVASGMNFKRKGFLELIELIEKNYVDSVFVLYRDRLVRFGFDFFEWFFSKHNTKLIVVNNIDDKPNTTKEIVDDFVSIIHYFAMKIYGSRKYKQKTKEIEKTLEIKNENIQNSTS